MTEEEKRLEEALAEKAFWRKWGPYLSERQWGSVREDYSPKGTAWEYTTHDKARSLAYRWGEEGIAGISDDKQQLCFSIALWNGKDPILKERLFGLTGKEGNHGEDVKEYYFYLDNLPSHAYMKYLYKYPQLPFPYEDLVTENKRRSRKDPEYELLDTGIFNHDEYYDVFIEYAKDSSEDILIQITIENRSDKEEELHLLPTLWFRNTWAFDATQKKPELVAINSKTIKATHADLGTRWLYAETANALLFTNNETNKQKIYNVPNTSLYLKDGINDYIIRSDKEAINPENKGTKAAAHHILRIGGKQKAVIKLRLSNAEVKDPFANSFTDLFVKRKQEADAFYKKVTPAPLSDDMRSVQRQAFAGLLWNKQCYHYNVKKWLKGDLGQPPPPEERKKGRNHDWEHLNAIDVFSMPDKWEYPWFAAWDLAFHTISLAMIDPDFAKQQLLLLTKEWYMHPNGQIPAYEWEFGDVNPPVHAWAAMRIYQIEEKRYGKKDRAFLEEMFEKLLLNFSWWVNRKDAGDRNVFEGGFLGLDNIGAFDRTLGPPAGGLLEQPDGTGWMGMYCLNLLQISLELAIDDAVYENMASKFFEHFIYIADALNNIAGQTNGLWDEQNGFYYGLLIMPDGSRITMKEETLTGIIPLFGVATNHPGVHTLFPNYRKRFKWFIENKKELLFHIGDVSNFDTTGQVLISLATPKKLEIILKKVLDEDRFFSPYGIRSVSKIHEKEPFVLHLGMKEFRLDYEPGESTIPLFGGNSNWRGPIWFPLNFLLLESLQKFDYYLGDDFKVECPTGSGKFCTLWEVSYEISTRLINIFLKDEKGKRPLYGNIEKFQTDPHFKDYILFHEYFHGDTGFGLGASNQTGWSGLIAKMIDQHADFASQKNAPRAFIKGKIGNL